MADGSGTIVCGRLEGALSRYLATYKKLDSVFASIEFQN